MTAYRVFQCLLNRSNRNDSKLKADIERDLLVLITFIFYNMWLLFLGNEMKKPKRNSLERRIKKIILRNKLKRLSRKADSMNNSLLGKALSY